AFITHIHDFYLDVGAGFAFMGNQYHLEIDGENFYINLLFYHRRLGCLVVINLKMQAFASEFAGKMNFYLAAINDLVRHAEDQPLVGIILCRGKNKKDSRLAVLQNQ
ncbi:MAG: DUF1016 family protein, partial [Abitibacteriaceae bacterium]|nr:DUF1016 family protein [Abditibacteriaceae bacterium]